MNPKIMLCAALLLAQSVAAEDAPAVQSFAKVDVPASQAVAKSDAQAAPAEGAKSAQPKAAGGDKTLSGMSILGNQEAPKALVIVPWKSSQLGDTLGIDRSLDDSRQPVDRDVFMRELSYYEIRSGAE